MVWFGVLGPLEALDSYGAPIDLGGRQPRTMVAVLLAASGRAVSVDAIADAVWGDEPPASALATLQSYVSRLRRRFGHDVPLLWDDTGYRLDVGPDDVDFRRFERLADEGRALLDSGDARRAREVLLDAERLWRGPAFSEFADLDFARGVATRLEERRLSAIADRIEAELALGHHAAVVGQLRELVDAYPLQERLRGQLSLALYRSGRQADALRALADAGRTLREELGIEPSRPLRDLEAAILAHDPSLEPPPAAPGAAREPEAAAPPSPAAASPPTRSSVEPTQSADSGAAAAPRGVALVGRDTELRQLVAALEESAQDSRFVVIEGEPGIGKTRLGDELRAIALQRGALAVWGRSDEGGAAPALWPWLPPLRAVAERAGEVPRVVEQLLAGETPMSAGQAHAAQFERFEAVAEVLEQVGAAQTVVVLLDDLQWADDTSLELLCFLAGRLGRGVLVAATMRQLEVGRNDAVTEALAAIARRPGSRRLQLRGLSGDDTVALLDAAGCSVGGGVAAAIQARAEGNPFYTIELSRLVDEEGGLSAQVPGTVGAVIRRRLSRLPRATVELLGVGAVVGRDLDLNQLARASGQSVDEAIDILDPAVVHRLLVEVPDQPAVLRFSHALVRQVLLDDMTSLRRARLHLKVADAIEAAGAGVDDAEILADHLWRAAPVGVAQRAAEALERAAEVALRRVAYAAAEDLLVKAVQLRRATGSSAADQEAELLAISRLLEVARARRYFQGATDLHVLERGKELAERVGRRDILLNLMWFEWSALATACRRAESDPLARAFAELTKDDPRPETRAAGVEVMGVLYWQAGRITDSAEHLEAAMRLLADAPPPQDAFDAEMRFVSRCFWTWTHTMTGALSPEESYAEFDRLIELVPDRFAVSSICGFAATTAIALGDWATTERFVGISVEADPSSEFAFWGGQVLMQRGIVAAWKGDVDTALVSFTEGRARYTSIGGRSGVPTFEASVALSVARQGRVTDALRLIESARAEFETYDERWNEPIVLIGEAVVAHAAGDTARAAERLERAAEVATGQGSHVLAHRAQRIAAELKVRQPA